jgi:hypothetical protein
MKFQVQYQNKNWPKDCWEVFAEARFDSCAKMIANYLLSIGCKAVRIDKTETITKIGKPFSKPIKFKAAESP